MEHLSVKKAINLARNFGAAGVLAAALVMTSGCSQADDRQTAVQVADSDNAQEDGVYGKMEYSVTGVEVYDSSAGDGGKVAVVRWHAINNRSADSCAVGSYITAYQNKQILSSGFADDLQESASLQGLAPGGECDGVSTFELNDMSPIEVKTDGYGTEWNSLDQTFELE